MSKALNPVKNPGPPNRKAKARLDARVKDYYNMLDSGKSEKYLGYHKPGSMQGPR